MPLLSPSFITWRTIVGTPLTPVARNASPLVEVAPVILLMSLGLGFVQRKYNIQKLKNKYN